MVALEVNTKYLILGAFGILLDLWAGGRWVGWRSFRCFMYRVFQIPNQNMNGYSEHHMPLHKVHIKLVPFLTPQKPTSGFPTRTFKLLKIFPPSA